ncbi:GTPase, partial [Staphylococcus warneri]
VKAALSEGKIAQFRYDQYLQLYNEIADRQVRY